MNPEDMLDMPHFKDLQVTCNGVPMKGGCSDITCGESENKKPLFTPQTITLTGHIDSVFNHIYNPVHRVNQYNFGGTRVNAFFVTADMFTKGRYRLNMQQREAYVRNLSRRVSLRRRIIAGMTP